MGEAANAYASAAFFGRPTGSPSGQRAGGVGLPTRPGGSRRPDGQAAPNNPRAGRAECGRRRERTDDDGLVEARSSPSASGLGPRRIDARSSPRCPARFEWAVSSPRLTLCLPQPSASRSCRRGHPAGGHAPGNRFWVHRSAGRASVSAEVSPAPEATLCSAPAGPALPQLLASLVGGSKPTSGHQSSMAATRRRTTLSPSRLPPPSHGAHFR